ncbi:desulfoferrodoxin [Candidatus Falkowbacteria bacterium]|nr:desulfoferrodoxin [Candidatus Falkowbacteria bacterium]
MTQLKQIYKCNVCGNIVEVLHAGAGELVCCGQPMQLQTENTVDAAHEKHVPVIEKVEDGYLIKVGEVPHPMTEEHYIEWIEVEIEDEAYKKFLKPGDKPEFLVEEDKEIKKARAYCNLHGLWKS